MGGAASASARAFRRLNWGRILRSTGTGVALAGGGGMAAELVSAARSGARALDAIRRDSAEDGVSPLYMRLSGRLPLHSKVLRDRREIAEYLYDQIDKSTDNPVLRRIGRSQADMFARSVESGANAAFMGRDWLGRPVFAMSKGGIGRRVLLREVGHYLASKKRPSSEAYMKEYERGAGVEKSLRNLFRPRLKSDSSGNLTRYGMEAEAWDLGGVPEGDAVREAALGSYDADSRVSRASRAGWLAILGGALLSAAGKARRIR